MTIAHELAQSCHDIRFSDLPPEAVRWAKIVILDTIGVALAGSVEECTRIVDKVASADGSRGPSLVFGANRRAPASEAALVNGTAAHALDFDCTNSALGGHPAIHVVPAVYALSEATGADGKAFIAALVAGLATQLRMAAGVQPQHFLEGWFTSSTIGVFGATAAACHLLGLAPPRTAAALGVASMLASGVIGNAGTMAKPLAAGHCARNGLLAALLAREGFTAAPDAIENPRGFLPLFNGVGRYDADAIIAARDEPLDVVTRGLGIKQYPCCGIVHASIDVMRKLVAEHSLAPEHIDRVEALIHPQRIHHVDRPDPRTSIEAKFSAQDRLALTIMQGPPALEDFEGERHMDPAVRKLMARIELRPDPTGAASAEDLGEQFGGDIRIETTDGRSLRGQAAYPLGGRPDHPLPRPLLDAKFMNCAQRVLDASAASQLLDKLWHLDEVANVQSLSAVMAPL